MSGGKTKNDRNESNTKVPLSCYSIGIGIISTQPGDKHGVASLG